MQVLIDIINQRLAELQIEAVCRHNKDDILIASTDPSSCKEAAAVAMEVFSEHGFHPNPTKSCGPTDRVRFCGVVLHAGGHRPEGSRQVFTESTFELAWSEFASPPIKSTKTFNGSEAVRLARLAWLRKWSGIMNYLRNHLPPDVLASLYVLQDALSRYQKDESIPLQEELVDPQNDNVTSINKAFSSLLHFYLSGVPPMVATNLGCSLLGTVILADSNADSWSAVVLRASVRNDADKDTPNSVDVPLAFPDSQYLFDTTLIEPMVLLPVRMLGGRWSQTDKKRSSTWRERAAVVAAIADTEYELQGPVTVILDNQNGMKTWKDVVETFHGIWITRWEAFCRNVTKVVWVSRSNCPRWPDALARGIADDDSIPMTDTTPDTTEMVDNVFKPDATLAHANMVALPSSSTSSSSSPVAASSDPDSAGPDPIGICADLLIGLQRCFRAWKSRVPFEQSFDAPVDPEAARRWLHDAQGQDEECDKIRLLISHKLSRFLVDGDGLIRLRDRYVIPRKYACDIARKYHHYFGHLDSKQTVACISKDFYVFGLARAVQRVISRCVCQYTRARRGTDRPVATSLQGALAPMECVFIDVVGPFPSSSKHPYRFVLSCMDAATRYVWYFALRSTTSQSLIDVLEANVVYPHGCMRTLRMDNAPSFRSVTFRGWCLSRGILPTYVPSYAPHRNSLLERQHAVLKKVLKTLCAGNPDLWPGYVPVAMARCNSRYVGNTMATPFELLFGRQYSSPWSNRFQDLRSGISDDSVKFEADRRCKRREVQLKNVMDLLDKAEADCALRPPDSIGSNVRRQFKKGDLVLRWREAQHSLDSSWYGPFSVTDVYGDYTYRLNDGSVHDSKTLCTFHPVHH